MVLVKVLWILTYSVIFYSCVYCVKNYNRAEEFYAWKYVEYKNLPKAADYFIKPDEPYYIPENTNIEGVGYHATTGLFIVTVGRLKKGIPSTVNAFCAHSYKEKGTINPKVWGFPSYEINALLPEFFKYNKKPYSRTTHESEEETKKDVKDEHSDTTTEGKEEEPEFGVISEGTTVEIVENTEKNVKVKREIEMKEEDVSSTKFETTTISEYTTDGVVDSFKKGSVYGNKHSSGPKDKNKYPIYHGSNHDYDSKPDYSHGDYNKPDYSHGDYGNYKPDYSHGDKDRPQYSHGDYDNHKPDYSYGEKDKPEYGVHGAHYTPQYQYEDKNKPDYSHGDYNKPEFQYGQNYKPQYSYGEYYYNKAPYSYGDYFRPEDKHRNKNKNKPQIVYVDYYQPNYSQSYKPLNYEYYKPTYNKRPNKPHYSNAVSKHQKNKYGSLSQIHSLHSHSSKKKDVIYIPVPHKEPQKYPHTDHYPSKPDDKYPDHHGDKYPNTDHSDKYPTNPDHTYPDKYPDHHADKYPNIDHSDKYPTNPDHSYPDKYPDHHADKYPNIDHSDKYPTNPEHHYPDKYPHNPDKYPDYPDKNPLKSTNHIISVYHPVIDNVCDRVWLLDTGTLEYEDGFITLQLVTLWVVDIPQHKACGSGPYNIIKHYEFPRSVISDITGLVNLALDYKKGATCDDVYAYIPNSASGEISVYDYKNDYSWTFGNHYSFFPVLKASTFKLLDEEVTSIAGINSITLGWRDASGYRTAYYISPTSSEQFGVSTELLKQKSLAPDNYNYDDFHSIGNRGCDGFAAVHVFDSKNGVIFYGDRNKHSLRCWNVRKALTPDNIDIVYYDVDIAYVHDISIDEYGYLWFLSNNYPIYAEDGETQDITDINIRLYRIHVDIAIKGTLCANDDDEYKASGVYDYPKATLDFFSQLENATNQTTTSS
ncbi:hypothetical protein DMENIID0001_027310 [Sergentomyia squamirostris]